jgi:hypothetical protein
MSNLLSLSDLRFEWLAEGERFVGLGKIWIGETLVRSGRLPMTIHTVSFQGRALVDLLLREVRTSDREIRIVLTPRFRPAEIRFMRDHSFDPIHDTEDWDAKPPVSSGRMDLVLRPACDAFNGVTCRGFSYHYEFSEIEPGLFYLMDKATWELDGDIAGATVISQSACSDPEVTFAPGTEWTTEGLLHGLEAPNPVMTHNLPRWAGHQAFDFQWKDGRALLGIFSEVGLVRSVLRREAEKAELKTFDKQIFDETKSGSTVTKAILLAGDLPTPTAARNFWTWIFDDVHARARAEFGLQKEPTLPRISCNYWINFTIDSYYRDLLPAAKNIGVRQVFIDNINKSDLTEGGISHNMCCGHEYEPAPALGGEEKLREFVTRAKEAGIQVMSWTNNDQSYSSPLNAVEDAGAPQSGWWVRMEDTRLRYGGAYSNSFSIWSFNHPDARRYWMDCLIRTRETTGLNGYLFDSFYNLGFMPLTYEDGRPTTMWKNLLLALKELQDRDVHFLIESFGPFGQPQHGCPRSYNIERCWACYEIGVGNDYSTVPTGLALHRDDRTEAPEILHFILAHKTVPPIDLHRDGKRVDERWGEAHRRALADYHDVLPFMHRRYLQEDGQAVLWHNAAGNTAVIFSFAQRDVELSGQVRDVTHGRDLAGPRVRLEAGATYTVRGVPLPVRL